MGGATGAMLIWSFGLLMCLGCPIGGFALRHYRQLGPASSSQWLPPLGALIGAFFRYHPY